MFEFLRRPWQEARELWDRGGIARIPPLRRAFLPILTVVEVVIPILVGLEILSALWLAPWLVGVVYLKAASGSTTHAWRGFSMLQSSRLAGAAREINGLVAKAVDRSVAAVTPDRVTASLLQRIVEDAVSFCSIPQNVVVRAALVAPQVAGGSDERLKVINYNELSPDRHWSSIDPREPGAVQKAYDTGKNAVVADTTVEAYARTYEGKPYKSVAAFPVTIRKEERSGLVVAVVTLDASEQNVFTEDLLGGLGVVVSPYVQLVGAAHLAGKNIEGEEGAHATTTG